MVKGITILGFIFCALFLVACQTNNNEQNQIEEKTLIDKQFDQQEKELLEEQKLCEEYAATNFQLVLENFSTYYIEPDSHTCLQVTQGMMGGIYSSSIKYFYENEQVSLEILETINIRREHESVTTKTIEITACEGILCDNMLTHHKITAAAAYYAERYCSNRAKLKGYVLLLNSGNANMCELSTNNILSQLESDQAQLYYSEYVGKINLSNITTILVDIDETIIQ